MQISTPPVQSLNPPHLFSLSIVMLSIPLVSFSLFALFSRYAPHNYQNYETCNPIYQYIHITTPTTTNITSTPATQPATFCSLSRFMFCSRIVSVPLLALCSVFSCATHSMTIYLQQYKYNKTATIITTPATYNRGCLSIFLPSFGHAANAGIATGGYCDRFA